MKGGGGGGSHFMENMGSRALLRGNGGIIVLFLLRNKGYSEICRSEMCRGKSQTSIGKQLRRSKLWRRHSTAGWKFSFQTHPWDEICSQASIPPLWYVPNTSAQIYWKNLSGYTLSSEEFTQYMGKIHVVCRRIRQTVSCSGGWIGKRETDHKPPSSGIGILCSL